MYWGGQAVRITLGGLVGPRFVHIKNTLPESANVETVDLVSFFLFVLIFSKYTPAGFYYQHKNADYKISTHIACATGEASDTI